MWWIYLFMLLVTIELVYVQPFTLLAPFTTNTLENSHFRNSKEGYLSGPLCSVLHNCVTSVNKHNLWQSSRSQSTSRAACSLKPAPLVNNLSTWTSLPPSSPWGGRLRDRQTNSERLTSAESVGGEVVLVGPSKVECLLQRILLVGLRSQLSGVHRAEQTPSGQLECSWAVGVVGLMQPPTLRVGDGLGLSINSASRNH